MTLLKSFLLTSTMILSSAIALAQVSGTIGRPGDGRHGGVPGTIERPGDHNPPGNPYPGDGYPDDRYPDDRYPGDRYPGDRDGYGRRQIIHCGSVGYRYNACPVRGYIVRVNLMRQHSHSACNEGYSWGYTQDLLWVDHGCEAEFDVITSNGGGGGRPGPGPGPRPPRPPREGAQVILCESSGYNFNQCFVGGYGQIVDVQLLQQRSRTVCNYGYNWGFDGESVWVDRGCSATFRVFKGYGVYGRR